MEPVNERSDFVDESSLQFFVLSVDTLCGRRIDQNIGEGWRDRPPLLEGVKPEKQKEKLDEMVRGGIPPALRCAVWTSCVIRASHPERDAKIADEYGTLGKVRALEHGWGIVISKVFPDASDEAAAVTAIPDFGLGKEKLGVILSGNDARDWEQKPVSDKGRMAMARVLCSVRQMFGVQYSPMIPDITALLLNFMPESYAYLVLRELVSEGHRFLPTTVVEHYTWCKTFADVVKKMYPETAQAMMEIGASTPEGLSPIFERFFVPLFRREHMLRILDIYLLEGSKLLFRIGVVLIGLVKKPLKAMNINNADGWWESVRDVTHDPSFDFERMIRKSYGNIGGKLRKSVRFPRRRVIQRIIKMNEGWAEENTPSRLREVVLVEPPRPLGLVGNGGGDSGDDASMCVLAKTAAVRLNLSAWLPPSLRGTKLELIFSSDVHGRSLERFYDRVSKTKRTFLLLEVLDNDAVIGMFATSAWHSTSQVYGDGSCFLFRASPDPRCYKWAPNSQSTSFDDLEERALMERFMVSRNDFISMGGNRDGTCGLWLNEDLSRGSSASALGFKNYPLAGGGLTDFEVGLVEVYRLVREIDGVPLDGVDEIWNF